MIVKVHPELPRWTIDAELFVCNIWVEGKPCWLRGGQVGHKCYACRLTELLRGVTQFEISKEDFHAKA